jgi:hypothetical protein
MKQYRITTENSGPPDNPDDAILSPNDPIHELKRLQYLGGLGAEARLAEYRTKNTPNQDRNNSYGETFGQASSEKLEIMKKNNIRPGDPEWFRLWFSRPYWFRSKST